MSENQPRWDEPQPRDDRWRKLFRKACNSNPEKYKERMERLGFEMGDLISPVLLDAIDKVQSELQDVREERDEWWAIAQGNNDELKQAKERIEEAIGLAKHHLSAQHKVEVNGLAKDILEILSPRLRRG